MKKVEILECTLRDGSYIVRDQFTAKDTAYIVGVLENLGFKYIEIGPGVGVNAKAKSKLKPASEDIEYVQAAVKAKGKAKIGMFFIPGIGRKEDLDMLSQEGMDFIRIGIEADNPSGAKEYVEYAKRLGFFTTVNFMKSYAVDKVTFASIAKDAHDIGADVVYIVDSAGGMLPADVEKYIKAVKQLTPAIKLGFHGHDNLSLAVANTIKAIECGVEFVDTTIRGLGRSSGNAVTEKVLLILDRMGYQHHIDVESLFVFSDKTIKPFLANKDEMSTDYVMGYSQFHSGYLDSILKMAVKYNIDPNKLIMEYSKIDKVKMDETILEELAGKINNKPIQHFNFTVDVEAGSDIDEQLSLLKASFIEYKNKFNALAFFNICRAYTKETSSVSPVIHSIENVFFGSAEIVQNNEHGLLRKICNTLGESVDGILVDDRLSHDVVSRMTNRERVLIYNDAMIFADSIYNYLKWMKRTSDDVKSVYLDIHIALVPFLHLENLELWPVQGVEQADIIVVGKNYFTLAKLGQAKQAKWILVTVPGMLDPQISESGTDIRLIRIDLRMEIFSEIVKGINYRKLFTKNFGSKTLDGTLYCSGGFIGEKGSLVVDDIHDITKIYGTSNGDGSIHFK